MKRKKLKAGSKVSCQSWSTWFSKTHSSAMILFFFPPSLASAMILKKKEKMPSKYPYNKGLYHLCKYFISEYTFILKVFPFIQPKFVMVSKSLSLFFFNLFPSSFMEELSIISCFLFTLYLKSMLFVSQFPSKNYFIQPSTIFLK